MKGKILVIEDEQAKMCIRDSSGTAPGYGNRFCGKYVYHQKTSESLKE